MSKRTSLRNVGETLGDIMARPKKAKLSFACKDIGMDCGFTATASSEEELMAKIAEHARTAHNMQSIDDATKAKIKAAIKKQ